MAKVSVIDADAHIIESEAMWDRLEGKDKRFRPTAVKGEAVAGQENSYWMVNGTAMRRFGSDPEIPDGVRDLTDVRGRLAKMDELGIDIQVIYPTFFLGPYTDRVETAVALSRCYNSFLAAASRKSEGRLRWTVVVPTESITDALAEMVEAKSNGACALVLRGIEGRRILSDPHFLPLYEKAESLDLPVCVHVGNSNRFITENFGGSAMFSTRAPVLAAFHDFLLARIPDRFPKLRFAFVEAGGQWVPYAISEVRRRAKWLRNSAWANILEPAQASLNRAKSEPSREMSSTLMSDQRMYVSCRIDDDLGYLLRWTGPGNLMTGTDYGHDDYAKEHDAFAALRGVKGYDDATIDGICGNNARRLYGL